MTNSRIRNALLEASSLILNLSYRKISFMSKRSISQLTLIMIRSEFKCYLVMIFTKMVRT